MGSDTEAEGTPTDGAWQTLRFQNEGAIQVLTLDRPELNLMNLEMRDELGAAFRHVREDENTRALVITGGGEAFSAGGDVNDFVGTPVESMHALMREKSHGWFKALWDLPIPTIAAVNGVAAGGGVNLALACDFVLASPNARFGQTFTKVGLIPDLGGLSMLPRSIGLHRAKSLCLSAELVDADRGHELGFVHEVVAASELIERAAALAHRLADGPADAFAALKATLNRSFELSMDELLHMELYAQSYLFATEEHARRLDGFLDRTTPMKGEEER